MNHYIHFEGMDLAGKSTVARQFSQTSDLDWIINTAKLTKINPILDFTNRIAKSGVYDSEILGDMYLAALKADIRKFQANGNIIQDSTILLRSLNFYKTLGDERLYNGFLKLVKEHPVPDKSFYLTANIDARLKRLNLRIKEMPEKITENDLMIKNDPNKFIQMDESLRDLSVSNFGSQVIDTSNLSVNDVVDIVQSECNFGIGGK
jgi:thymidylate kinase